MLYSLATVYSGFQADNQQNRFCIANANLCWNRYALCACTGLVLRKITFKLAMKLLALATSRLRMVLASCEKYETCVVFFFIRFI